MPETRPRFAIYARLSRDPDGTSTAIDRQLTDCRKFAELRGWEVVRVFDDPDISAWRKGAERPDYAELLGTIKSGEIDGVLVWRLDRLVRRTLEFAEFWDIAESAGVRLASATQPIDTSDPVGMLIVTILVAFAQMESETMSIRVKAQKREAAHNGAPNRGGYRPYGLTADWSAVVPEEAAEVRWMAEQALGGASLESITASLIRRDVPTTTGKGWSRRTVKRILTSPRVWGWREYEGQPVKKGEWPAILDEATGRALLALYPPGKVTAGRGTVKNVLSGILRCGKCRARMMGGWTDKRLRVYRCPPKGHGGCGGMSIRAEKSEAAVEGQVLDRLESEEASAAAAGRRERHAGSSEADILTRLAELDRMTTRLAEEQLDPERRLPRSAYIAEQRAIEAAGEKLNRELAGARAPDPYAIVGTGGGMRKRYAALPVPRRRAVILSLVEKVDVLQASSDLYLTRLRENLAAEADQYDELAADWRRKREDATDPAERRHAGAEATRWSKAASRRRSQVRDGTGGGRWRPERLDINWVT